jgi:hypothetical protein
MIPNYLKMNLSKFIHSMRHNILCNLGAGAAISGYFIRIILKI